MENNIINTLDHGERVTSYYAEAYFNDLYCDSKSDSNVSDHKSEEPINVVEEDDEWQSPSDALIGIVELKPPLTSKITRGKTHEGILAIGEEVLSKKRAKFMKHVEDLLNKNDISWQFILNEEKKRVERNVKQIYKEIFTSKCQTMTNEISTFLEKSLVQLEKHIKEELQDSVLCTHANIVTYLNIEIQNKLRHERKILEDVLQRKYEEEIKKVKHYYKMLLADQLYKHSRLVNSAVSYRNDALKAFCKQLDAETLTSTMYIMSHERKKCRIRQFIMKNYHDIEVKDKVDKIKEREEVIEAFEQSDTPINLLNQHWEVKVKKIVQMFLKFVSYSLKLLPEQTVFLFDFEKLFLLQMNEIQKAPLVAPTILLDEEKFQNILKFEHCDRPEEECTLEPIVVELDPSPPTPIRYGSRESLDTNVELPWFRVQRQFVYARCHNFEDIKKVLQSQICKCHTLTPRDSVSSTAVSVAVEQPPVIPSTSSSSLEPLLVEDVHRLKACPNRNCQDWFAKAEFPDLQSYMDYTEENYNRVKVILDKIPKREEEQPFVSVKEIAHRRIPFAETREPVHNVATQYSSQESFHVADNLSCTCIREKYPRMPSTSMIDTTLATKRKDSIKQLIEQNLKLLKFFTDESFELHT